MTKKEILKKLPKLKEIKGENIKSFKIIQLGIGALGSQLIGCIAPDVRNTVEITVLDYDKVEERNLLGTQYYTEAVNNMLKTEALQYLIYKNYGIEVNIITEKLTNENISLLSNFDLIVDTFDNYDSRKLVQDYCISYNLEVIHIGFNPQFTFSIEFKDNYTIPTDFINAPDICTLPGAASFVKMVASLGSLVVQEWLKNGQKREFVGNRLNIREIT